MSEESTNIDAEQPTEGSGQPPSKSAMALAAVFLTAPACIPFWYAVQQEDAMLKWLFIGAGFSLVVFNSLALVLIYRWIQRFNA